MISNLIYTYGILASIVVVFLDCNSMTFNLPYFLSQI